ncbi:hypothetical protein G1L02_12095 [Tenacibaculum finnmarkense]|uniref:hypothetical protein n=1 Tax=Tenacibaculum finnmarkense TaxID=2781243 RepID=UPI001EFBA11D|nr:hypothetical protein [Tenacibaculum finnmarkense]MCG8883893.1 hypothetical protein [Tenacibaculum finnmarkense]
MKHQENVKKWFETHDKPSQKQFYNFFKWIRWIDENISVQDIEGLNKLLIAKADKQAFNTHLQDEILHPSENDRENWNGKLDKTGTAVNSLKLGNHPPEYYANKATTYTKLESDNILLVALHELSALFLNNPDADMNSLQELQQIMSSADNTLVSSIANKVSYVVLQNLSKEQQKIAQANIGLLNHRHKILGFQDSRRLVNSIKPKDLEFGIQFFFSKNDINNLQGPKIDYCDLLVMNSWVDGTGGKLNALSFDKFNKSIKLFQAKQSADEWEDPTEIITDDNIGDYIPKQTVKPLSTVTSYMAKASDIGNIAPLSNANTQIILNTASFPRIGDTAKYLYKGTGTCKVATSGTATELCNINDTLEFDGQNSMIEITKTGANEYFVCGQLIRA